jgi:hypothetical protein
VSANHAWRHRLAATYQADDGVGDRRSIVCLDPQAKGPSEGASNETPDSRFSTECTRPHRRVDGSRKGQAARVSSDGEFTPASAGRSTRTRSPRRRCCGSSTAKVSRLANETVDCRPEAEVRNRRRRAQRPDRGCAGAASGPGRHVGRDAVSFEHYDELTTDDMGFSPSAGGRKVARSRIRRATRSQSRGQLT